MIDRVWVSHIRWLSQSIAEWVSAGVSDTRFERDCGVDVPVFNGDELDFVQLLGRRAADPFTHCAEPVSVRVVEIPPGPRTPHRHPHSCEVVYVADGRGRVWENDTYTDVRPGDVVLIPTGVPHATVCSSPQPLRLICFFACPDLSQNLEELAGPERT